MKNNLMILLLVFAFWGCKKSNEEFKGCLMESAVGGSTNFIGGSSLYYIYDEKGRIIQTTEKGSSYTIIYKYEYLDKKIKVIGKNQYYLYELDNTGKIVRKIDANGIIQKTYSYDSNGYLISITGNSGGKELITYANGNIIKTSSRSSSYLSEETKDFTYSSEPLKQSYFDIAKNYVPGIEVPLSNFFGKSSKMLVKTVSTNSRGGYTDIDTFVFKKDQKGNIIQMSRTFGTPPYTYTETTDYSYICY